MTKSDLVNAVSQKANLTKVKSAKAVDAVFESITEFLKNGEKVRLVGFGTFSVAKRKARTGRNPRTGEKIEIPATNSPKFTPAKELREAIKK